MRQIQMKSFYLVMLAFAGAAVGTSASAQNGVPLPGAAQSMGGAPQVSAPVPGAYAAQPAQRTAGAPAPGAGHASGYADLPINADDAKSRIEDLRNMLGTARPQELQDRVYHLAEWLGDMVDAHNKMANAFGKHEQTKNEAAAERQVAQRFSQLRNQAQLLKADLLIGSHRYPEALGPLVDIVIAEPTTGTGKAAYKRLRNLGFSPDASEIAATSEPAAAPVVAPPKKTAAAAPAKAR